MKYYLLLISLVLASPETSCQEATADSGKTLIVYLTRTRNTETVAQIIRDLVEADMVRLELETPYPKEYQDIVRQVARENESGYLPPLMTRVEVGVYDRVFVGFPTWGMKLPPPVKSFLQTHDLEGKEVIPFNTNGGYGVGSSFRQLALLCEECNILEGYSTRGGSERDGIYLAIRGQRHAQVSGSVKDWLEEIGVLTRE